MSRTVARVVDSTKINPAISRLIGTVDIDGAGTEHPLPEVDPFMLLDQGTVPKDGMPKFGPHPHRGHSVVTLLLQGAVKNWDSFKSKDQPRNILKAPASYWVDAGSGLFHDEVSVIENEEDPSQHMKIFQLWISVAEADRSKPPRVQISDTLLTVECLDPASGKVVGKATHYVGEGSGIETIHPICVSHVTQQAGTTYRVPMVPSHGGFVVHMNGKASYDNTEVESTNSVVVLENSDGNSAAPDYLQVSTAADSDTDVEYLVCSGERIQEPWTKKLVASGALICKTTEEGRELAEKVEAMSIAGKKEGGSFAPFGL
ncbi:unnamed protein product [Cylindrotheca closterium]|uniref:Pirin N-terminal domain-containing protein n=1 Tax=Cylindrotheca closterium TaxID=2856 RepID=A0AAD2FS62_9STRA|nr:unnamed protein product [Cylindrotheca closterium]